MYKTFKVCVQIDNAVKNIVVEATARLVKTIGSGTSLTIKGKTLKRIYSPNFFYAEFDIADTQFDCMSVEMTTRIINTEKIILHISKTINVKSNDFGKFLVYDINKQEDGISVFNITEEYSAVRTNLTGAGEQEPYKIERSI